MYLLNISNGLLHNHLTKFFGISLQYSWKGFYKASLNTRIKMNSITLRQWNNNTSALTLKSYTGELSCQQSLKTRSAWFARLDAKVIDTIYWLRWQQFSPEIIGQVNVGLYGNNSPCSQANFEMWHLDLYGL